MKVIKPKNYQKHTSMKVSLRTHHHRDTALSGLATPASAIVNWYNSAAGTDNSGGATVDNTIDQSGSWVDTTIGSALTTPQGAFVDTQANGPSQLPGRYPARYAVFSFGDLGIAAGSTVNSASLSLHASQAFGAVQTYTIYGLTGTVDNNINWTNANLDTATASNQYGTFSSSTTTGAFSINLQAAIQAYIDGTITGIAIGTTGVTGLSNAQNYMVFDTSENTVAANRPSLMVDFTPIPEPATCALLFGLAALVGVVRRHRNHNSSNAAMLPA